MKSLIRCILRCVRCRNAGLILEDFAKPVLKIKFVPPQPWHGGNSRTPLVLYVDQIDSITSIYPEIIECVRIWDCPIT
jgi:hypothetical protein